MRSVYDAPYTSGSGAGTSGAPGPGYVWDPIARQWVPADQMAATNLATGDTRNYGTGAPLTAADLAQASGIAAPTTVGDVTPPPDTGGTGGTGGLDILPPYTGPSAPTFDQAYADSLPPAPAFSFQYDPFTAPTAEQALAEPGYQFTADEGRRAVEQSAAGRGVLRTGGTLKDILKYGQSLATQQYGNVYNRAADTYDRNYGNSYQLAKDSYAPKLQDWAARVTGGQRAGELGFNRAYDVWTNNANQAYQYWNALYQGGQA